MLQSLKIITSSLLFLAVCFHSIHWIESCEQAFIPWKPQTKLMERRCELIWEKLAYEMRQEAEEKWYNLP